MPLSKERQRGGDPIALVRERAPQQFEDLLRVVDDENRRLAAVTAQSGAREQTRTGRRHGRCVAQWLYLPGPS
jgi:hypothetical protein